MTRDEWTGFILGCALGFDLDSIDVEAILADRGLGSDCALADCREAIRAHVADDWEWELGLAAIRDMASGGRYG